MQAGEVKNLCQTFHAPGRKASGRDAAHLGFASRRIEAVSLSGWEVEVDGFERLTATEEVARVAVIDPSNTATPRPSARRE